MRFVLSAAGKGELRSDKYNVPHGRDGSRQNINTSAAGEGAETEREAERRKRKKKEKEEGEIVASRRVLESHMLRIFDFLINKNDSDRKFGRARG